MFQAQDYSKVHNYINGTKLDARAWVTPKTPAEVTDVKITEACSLDISGLREDKMMASSRWENSVSSRFDARASLVGVYEGVRESVVEVGRDWKANLRDFKVNCVTHVAYGSSKVALVPAVAGMATKDMSAASITAWTQFNVLLGITGTAGPPDYAVMNSMMRVHNTEANPVRFIHRLAALYLHLVWTERCYDKIQLNNRPNVENIGSTAAVTSLIARAQVGYQFIPWSSRGGLDDADVLAVLLAAGSGRLQSTRFAGSRFLKLWPFLGSDVVLLVDDIAMARALQNTRVVDLTSRQVWFAACRWITQYSDMKLWDEALTFVGAFCVSPSKGVVLTPGASATYGLPASNMGQYALGRFIEPLEEGSLATVLGEPNHATMIEGHVVLATLLGLMAWYGAWKVCGWFYHYNKCNDADAREYWRRYASTSKGAPIWKHLQSQLGLLVSGNIGRIFSTVTYGEVDAYKKLSAWHSRALQFEELVSRTGKVFDDTAIYGLLSPLRPTRESFNRGAWTTVGEVPAFANINRAWYSMYTKADLALVTRGRTVLTSARMNLPVSYRGAITDYALFSGIDRAGNKFEPAFRVTNKVHYYELVDEKSRRYNYTWYVEEADGSALQPANDQMYGDYPPIPPIGGAPDPPPGDDSDDESRGDEEEDDKVHEGEESDAGSAGPPPRDLPVGGVKSDLKTNYPHLSAMLSRAENWNDRGDYYQVAVAVETLYRHGVPNMLTNALASLATQGVSDDQARIEIDMIREFDVYETLLPIAQLQRTRVCNAISKVLLNSCRNVTAGRVTKELIQKYMAINAAKNCLTSNPAMTADEYVGGLSWGRKEAEGLLEMGAAGQKVVATGRLPTKEMCRALLEAGYPISAGLAGKGKMNISRPAPSAVALDDIESMMRVLVESAWDAGVEPDMEYLRDIAGPNFAVAELVSAMKSGREMAAQLQLKSESLNVSGSDGDVALTEPSSRILPQGASVPQALLVTGGPVTAAAGTSSAGGMKESAAVVITKTGEAPTAALFNVVADASSVTSSEGTIRELQVATFVETIPGDDGAVPSSQK